MNEFVCVRVWQAETVENFQQTKRGLHDLHGVRGLKSAFQQVICLFFGWSTSTSLTEAEIFCEFLKHSARVLSYFQQVIGKNKLHTLLKPKAHLEHVVT